ncbi:hypothetical protein J1N35_013932 [Gossypium stocksii]|uniref:Uncharacterized protein n=1 Tax=Gossypium stocksii TaxID=47602 RepID=A0A9D4A993_9ROSI|nr:hypothetical protein J1N35_013932 [Gossypium stocksii]
MKRKISAKIATRCGRTISRLFYKFPISIDPLKFCDMQVLHDNELGTMIEIWWLTRNQLECGVTSQIPENPNYGRSSCNNPTPDPRLQIHPEVIISIEADIGERTNKGENSDQDVEDFSDLDVDEVLNDIDDECPEEAEDVHGPSFSNPSRGIILRNELGSDMLNVNSDATHASEFPKFADIVPAPKLELFCTPQMEPSTITMQN